MSIFVLSPATYYLLPLTVLKDVNVSSLSGSDFTPPGTTPPPPPPVGTLQFSVPTFSVNEDGTTIAAVTLTRTDGSSGAVSVSVLLNGGSISQRVQPVPKLQPKPLMI